MCGIKSLQVLDKVSSVLCWHKEPLVDKLTDVPVHRYKSAIRFEMSPVSEKWAWQSFAFQRFPPYLQYLFYLFILNRIKMQCLLDLWNNYLLLFFSFFSFLLSFVWLFLFKNKQAIVLRSKGNGRTHDQLSWFCCLPKISPFFFISHVMTL